MKHRHHFHIRKLTQRRVHGGRVIRRILIQHDGVRQAVTNGRQRLRRFVVMRRVHPQST